MQQPELSGPEGVESKPEAAEKPMPQAAEKPMPQAAEKPMPQAAEKPTPRAAGEPDRDFGDALPLQVWTARPDGQLDWVNRRVLEYFGRTFDEMIGVGWQEYIHPEDLAEVLERWTTSLRTGDPYEVAFRLRSVEGDYRMHVGRALPSLDAEGRVVRWFGSNMDVEERHRARLDMERANRAKSDFLASMSHELRTPLNAIGGHLELIALGIHGPVTEAQLASLTRIRNSQEHLLRLINDILQFAKVEAGRLEYRVTELMVGDLAADVVGMLEPQARSRELALELVTFPPGLTVRADRDRVQQILINLLGNAIKFTDGGGRVTLSAERAGDFVLVRTADTGGGIPPEHLEAIFDPFVQVRQIRATAPQGVGLGLAISRDLARAMGGDLTVESEVGAGSVFTLSLPAATPAAP